MNTLPVLALCLPDVFPGATFLALTLTAAIVIPSCFLFGFLGEWRAAKISKKHT